MLIYSAGQELRHVENISFWFPLKSLMETIAVGNHNIYFGTITKTYLYNSDPFQPHFYIVKLGFTGVYIIFLISTQNIACGYSLEWSRQGGSNEYPQSMFCAEI